MQKFYGTIALSEHGNQWSVTAEPHILLRIKRVFEKIDKSQFGSVTLSNTPENCRDLEWFCQRYPMKVEPREHKALRSGRKKHEDHVLRLERIIDPNYMPPQFKLALPLRDYQARAVELYLQQRWLVLGDDVGLGKTAVAIGSLTDPRTLPAMVVAYPHLQLQWESQIRKFAPDLSVHIVQKRSPYELPKFMGKGPDVVIATYHKISGWVEVLSKYVKSAIFDETQELRLSNSDKYAAARSIAGACDFRIGLTATPIFNYGGEFFNIIEVIQPGAMGTREEFMREWC